MFFNPLTTECNLLNASGEIFFPTPLPWLRWVGLLFFRGVTIDFSFDTVDSFATD